VVARTVGGGRLGTACSGAFAEVVAAATF